MKRRFIHTINKDKDAKASMISLNSLQAEELGEFTKLPVPRPEFIPVCQAFDTNNLVTQPFNKHISRTLNHFTDE